MKLLFDGQYKDILIPAILGLNVCPVEIELTRTKITDDGLDGWEYDKNALQKLSVKNLEALFNKLKKLKSYY